MLDNETMCSPSLNNDSISLLCLEGITYLWTHLDRFQQFRYIGDVIPNTLEM